MTVILPESIHAKKSEVSEQEGVPTAPVVAAVAEKPSASPSADGSEKRARRGNQEKLLAVVA